MRYLLLLLLLPLFSASQDVTGFFVHDLYYVNPAILVQQKITRIEIISSLGRGQDWTRTLGLDGNGKRVFETERQTGPGDTTWYDNAPLWYFSIPKNLDSAVRFYYEGAVLHRKFPGRSLKTEFDSQSRPVRDVYSEPGNKVSVERLFKYNSRNLLDTVWCNFLGIATNSDYYVYKWDGDKLSAIEHYYYFPNTGQHLYESATKFKYNDVGLISSYTGSMSDDRKVQITVRYYAGERRVR
ncbi:MAG TPA: hypothetical protein VD993_15940 [Chitinophagaceae bacterium]|nr:hypothetical protein [Chitinophagaceae bacterium]